MASSDPIRKRARSDLAVTTEQGVADQFLWEHTIRVVRNAGQIARLPVVQAHRPDETAILAAAYYHDAGWVAQFRDRQIGRLDILLGPCPAASREQAALMVRRSLADLVPAHSLERAARAILALSDREIDSIEGQVVLDADNLDEFGLISLWASIRRGAIEGKGIQAVVDKWRRQKEYRFWTTRLKKSFRFAPVQELARKRLAELERFMEELGTLHLGHDVATLLNPDRADQTPQPVGR